MSTVSKRNWRKRARQYLAVAFGGKCTICGYDKAIAALDYHHINPNEKDSMLCVAMRNGYAWSKIVREARKCTIVCCRCHREIHAGVTVLPDNYATFNEEYVDVIKLRKAEFDACPICGEEKNKRQKYCSVSCSVTNQMRLRRFEIAKDDLAGLVHEKPYTEIAKMFGVTDNAIKKRCMVLGITIPNRWGYWSKKKKKALPIPVGELEELLKTKSIDAIAQMLGIGAKTLKKMVLEAGLVIPPINWKKKAGKARWGKDFDPCNN